MRPSSFLVTLLAAIQACSQAVPPARAFDQPFSPAELQRDVARLRTSLVEGHPALTKYRQRREIDSIFRALDDSVRTPRTALAFWKLTSIAVAGIRDDHTGVVPNSAMFDALYTNPGRSLPLRLGVIDDRLYVLRNYVAEGGPPDGSEIVEVNGFAARQFIDGCKRGIPTDGDVGLRAVRKMERDFELSCALTHDMPAEYRLVVRTLSGESRSIVVRSIPWRERRKLVRARAPQDTAELPAATLTFLHDSTVALLTLTHAFSKADGFNPEKFIEQSFDRIRTAGARQLIIDLRGNTGGTDRYAGALYAQIARDTFTYYQGRRLNKRRFQFIKGTDDWMLNYAFIFRFRSIKKTPDGRYALKMPLDKPMKPHANAFTGPVYVLIDGNSVSTSSEFASVFKARDRGTIIGEESGSALIGGTGASVSVVLPETQLILNVPIMTAYIAPKSGSSDVASRGVMPDVPIRVTLDGRLKGRDPVLDRALELARGRMR